MSDMIKVAVTCPWGANSQQIKDGRLKLFPNNDGVWKNIMLHDDPYTADWIIGWETLDPVLDLSKINMSKVILIGREPPWILSLSPHLDNWHHFPEVKYKFKCALGNSHLVSSWSSKIKYNDLKKFEWQPRGKKICVVTTNKNFCQGHSLRLNFILEFCRRYPNVLDIYGNGAEQWCRDNGIFDHFKGNSPYAQDTAKHDWTSKYEYTLAIENGLLNGLFTEKFNDAIMALTKPIYWGAPDIHRYFPNDAYETLDITAPDAYEKVMRIIEKDITEKDILAMKKSRDLIMDYWAEGECYKRIIEEGKILPW